MDQLKEFLRLNIEKELSVPYGVSDAATIAQVTENWFDDNANYDGRWSVIEGRIPKIGRLLDMAAGCGTFVLFGLHRGYDVWGVEPEPWKREYFEKKIEVSGYPSRYAGRVLGAYGEQLPFGSETFDLVSTYQTLEHVGDVEVCLNEMLRVLKPGGVLYIKAPDYRCFYEPHYMLPFLPKMNKRLAEAYLKVLRRPTAGLKHLNWTTEKQVFSCLNSSGWDVLVRRSSLYRSIARMERIMKALPVGLKITALVRVLNILFEFYFKIIRISKIGREEKNIDLWVQKIS